MKFSRLRVLGFKSFVEPGEFVIEPGLTGVVGPNGCGKSNLVEALRWVMGESSHKNMRASGMDDVIFSGSSARPSRNAAEVTLFLDNGDRTAPFPFNDADEVQVTRRIEREAGSVYRINGRDARARDVQLLFADQSTGARSPSMVGQGRVGELIQAKPHARRALLEEAAGISGLHGRRHEAETRLAAAEQNVGRLDEVVGELENQMESLKRQARHALRFKTLSAEIRKTEALLLHMRWSLAKAGETETIAALNVATSQVAERAASQMRAVGKQAIGAKLLPELREAQAAAAAALQRLKIAKAQVEEEAVRAAARQAELADRIRQLDADITRERHMVLDNASFLGRLDAEKGLLEAESEGAGDRLTATRAVLDAAVRLLAESEAELGGLTEKRADALAARNQIERALRDSAERQDRGARQVAEIERERAVIAARIAALPEPAQKRRSLAKEEARLRQAEAVVSAEEQATLQARADESAARRPVAETRGALGRIEAEARTLAKMLSAFSGNGYAAVLEHIAVERGFEKAVGAALGDDLGASLNEEAPIHWRGAVTPVDDPLLPPGVRGLASVVQAPAQLARRLAQTGIVEAMDGARLQGELRPGQVLVSREGAIWRWDGFAADANAPALSVQRLAQKNRLNELEREAVVAVEKARGAEAGLRQAEGAVAASEEAEKRARQSVRENQAEVAEAREALAQAERATGEWATRHAALGEAGRRMTEALEEAEAAFLQAQVSLAQTPVPDELQTRFEASGHQVQRDRAAAAEARAAHEGLGREREARERRLEAIDAERVVWLGRAQSADRHIASLEARLREACAEQKALAGVPEELESRRCALLSQLTEADAASRTAADRLQEAENSQTLLDRASVAENMALGQAREVRARAEERAISAETRRVEAETRIRDTLNIAPGLAIRIAEVSPDAPLPEAGEVERRLDRLKIEREKLGAVNLRAEEEQRELGARLGTIVAERGDVIEAVAKLRQAIGSLNREGRERLLVAFEAVNVHFERLFKHLFGGGSAELQLISSEDPLEAGLEIIARPPGKKPQTMTLLSGGEQALTAMALIFAVFLTNPAPVCVLDEVDAPLDDHNVERFCNLLDEMAAVTETRFLVITHNPITMARMNRLFGVTMAEQGVSQLVSVDLQGAERIREAV